MKKKLFTEFVKLNIYVKLGLLVLAIFIVSKIDFNSTQNQNISFSLCGNGVCDINETETSCYEDCKKIIPKCTDSDGLINQESSYIKGICIDIKGVYHYDTCTSTDPSDPDNIYMQLMDYDCNSEGYCEPVAWYCSTDPLYECEYGACVECPGGDSKCTPSQQPPLEVPPAPRPAYR